MDSECSNHEVDRNSNVVVAAHCDNAITIEDIDEVIKRECTEELLPHSTPPLISPSGMASPDPKKQASARPYIRILVQPASKALRFRYECEGRSAGSLPGANSTPENKTFPTIQIMNCQGPAVVVASCVTKDRPHRPHPHKLVGKEGCDRGICTVKVNTDNMICQFSNVGIQCVKKKDIEEALKERKHNRVDPFRTGFDHSLQNIDLNAVKICFQAFIEGPEKGKFIVPLSPVVSDTIFDKKAMSELVIVKLSACAGSVTGGTELILLCEKVSKDDVEIRFYEEQDDQILWEAFGEFQPNDVHKQVAITFKTPPYHNQNIEHPVEVNLQLRKRSDLSFSEPRIFQYKPVDLDPEKIEKKRRKIAVVSLQKYLDQNTRMNFPMDTSVVDYLQTDCQMVADFNKPRSFKVANRRGGIKQEPEPARAPPPAYRQYPVESSTSFASTSASFAPQSAAYSAPNASYTQPSTSFEPPQQQQQPQYYQVPPTIRSPFEAMRLSPNPSPMLSGVGGHVEMMADQQLSQITERIVLPPVPSVSPSPTYLLLESSSTDYGNISSEEKKNLMQHLQQPQATAGNEVQNNSLDLNFPSIDSGDFDNLLPPLSDSGMNVLSGTSLHLSDLDMAIGDMNPPQQTQQPDSFSEVHNEIMQLNQLGQKQ